MTIVWRGFGGTRQRNAIVDVKQMEEIRLNRREGIIYAVTGLLFIATFLILYRQVIFGDITQMFRDVGCDSKDLIYPRLYIRCQANKGLFSSSYSLCNGFGGYVPPKIISFLDPINWPFLFGNEDNLVFVWMVSLGIQFWTTGIFSYKFFKGEYDSTIAAIVAAMCWTFSGYMVLWSQHLFSVSITYITISLFFLQQLLKEKMSGCWIVLSLAFVAMYSYYFFYMAGLFLAIYVLIYGMAHKWKGKDILVRELKLLGAGVSACGVSAILLIPSIRTFLNSARVGLPEQRPSGLVHSIHYLSSVLARFVSNNSLGVGNEFTGYGNYYEAGMFVTSLLVVPAVVYLLGTKWRKVYLPLLVLCIVAIVTPITSFVFNFDARSPRWSFVVTFVAVFTIGRFLNECEKNEKKFSIADATITMLVYGCVFGTLFLAEKYGQIDVKKTHLLMIPILLLAYLLVLWRGEGKCKQICLVGLVVVELISLNDATINQRISVTKDELNRGYYRDDTVAALESIKESDQDLYRMNKTFFSVYYNDAMVQAYPGVSVYDPTVSQTLFSYYDSFGQELPNGQVKYLRVNPTEWKLNSLLGVKYVISREPIELPQNYEVIQTEGQVIYRNNTALPFGYIYTDEVNKQSYEKVKKENRSNVLTKYFFYTDQVSEKDDKEIELFDDNSAMMNLKILQSRGSRKVEQKDKWLTLTIDVPEEKVDMLCVPIIYDSFWTATIDGTEAPIDNINGGLIGVNLSEYKGKKVDVQFIYRPKDYWLGAVISLLSIGVFILYVVKVRQKQQKMV